MRTIVQEVNFSQHNEGGGKGHTWNSLFDSHKNKVALSFKGWKKKINVKAFMGNVSVFLNNLVQ